MQYTLTIIQPSAIPLFDVIDSYGHHNLVSVLRQLSVFEIGGFDEQLLRFSLQCGSDFIYRNKLFRDAVVLTINEKKRIDQRLSKIFSKIGNNRDTRDLISDYLYGT